MALARYAAQPSILMALLIVNNKSAIEQRALRTLKQKKMYEAQGFRGLYAGCGITVTRSIPSILDV